MNIQDEIEEHERAIARLKAQQNQCDHIWKKVEYDPIRTKGYQAPVRQGAPIGTCPTYWVGPTETPQWSRTCSVCGLTQQTKRTKNVSRQGSAPGTVAKEQVPDFD